MRTWLKSYGTLRTLVAIEPSSAGRQHKKAKVLFDEAIHIPGSEAFACASLGIWYADMNQPDKVEEYLRGFQVMLPYHSDPRFVELLRKMGLD